MATKEELKFFESYGDDGPSAEDIAEVIYYRVKNNVAGEIVWHMQFQPMSWEVPKPPFLIEGDLMVEIKKVSDSDGNYVVEPGSLIESKDQFLMRTGWDWFHAMHKKYHEDNPEDE